MLKKIAFLFLVVSIFSCNQHTQGMGNTNNNGNNNKPEDAGGGATVLFSSLQEGRGTVVATVDGKEIKSGDKVAKGKIVSFTATPQSNRYVMRRWKGASYDEAHINEALLMIKDENATYAVRADFGSIVNFMRINSGEVKGAPVVPDITKEQLDKIIEGNQTINVKGPNVTILVGSTDIEWNPGSFKMNDEVKQALAYDNYKTIGIVMLDNLEIGKPFDVEFSQSVGVNTFSFKFKVLREAGLVDIPRVNLAIDGKKPEPMTETTLQELSNGTKPHFYSKKAPEIEVSSSRNFIKEVILEEKGKPANAPSVPTEQTLLNGNKKYYSPFYLDDIPLEGVGEPKEIKIRIIPKDTNVYSEVVWVFCLKQFDETDSAEFQGDVDKIGKFSPKIIYGIKWYDGIPHNLIDDYGAKSIVFTVQTVTKHANVHYQIVGLDGKPYNGSEEKIMINNGDTSHKSDSIALFEDKPTRIKMWVVSRTGKIRNDSRGVYYFSANPIPMRWGYSFTDDPAKVQGQGYNEGYDVIKIDRTQVKDGKVYVSFGIWDAFTVGTEGLAPEQKPFTKMKLNESFIQIEWYSTEVNISSLIDDNKESMDVFLPILEKGIPCFKYKVTLRLE